MRALQISPWLPLHRLLQPLSYYLDNCWWYLNGYGLDLRHGRPADGDLDRFITTIGDIRVGRPGFFRRYGACIEGDWKLYFVSDGAEVPTESFSHLHAQNPGWFESPVDVPDDICLIARDVDAAYWDFFVRDAWLQAELERGHRTLQRAGEDTGG